MSNYHISVLLKETIEYLQVASGKKYIDGTLGGGGHTFEILKQGGKVLGLDVDQDAIEYVEEKLRIESGELRIDARNLRLVRGNFKDIDTAARESGFETVDGILLDLGVSGHQFDTAERGFSYQQVGPLDMRMDSTLGVRAMDLVNALSKDELTELFLKLGEENFARRIASEIVEKRKMKPIETTGELEAIIRKTIRGQRDTIHPATRVFQALRIAVNDELNSLREVLPKAINLLSPGGRLAVISFHSLEDRIVKHAFLEFAEKGRGTVITKKPVVPSEGEVAANSRSRSAKLRVFEVSSN